MWSLVLAGMNILLIHVHASEYCITLIFGPRYMLDWLRREHQWKLPSQTFVQQNILNNAVLQRVPHMITQVVPISLGSISISSKDKFSVVG